MQSGNKMGFASINHLIITMSLPPLLSMFLLYSYNLIDSAFVAQLSENALTAVSLSFPITTLMNAISLWLGVGLNVLIAGYLGLKNTKKANETVTLGIILALGLGAILNIVVLLTMSFYFRAFTTNSEVYELCIKYMGVCSLMQIPNMVHIAIQKIIQATGNMVAPMWFQIVGAVINIVLNPLLIFGWGPFQKFGIIGSALATVIGYTISMVLAWNLLNNGKQKVTFKISNFCWNWSTVKNIFVLGFPSFVMNALGSFTVTIVNLFLISYSETAIAFFGAYFKLYQLIMATISSLIQGCLPLMRFNYTAGKLTRVKITFHYGLWYAAGLMMIGSIIVYTFPSQILHLFAASQKMQVLGISAMRIMALGFLFGGLTTIIATYFQAIERIIASIALQFFRQLIILVPCIWVLEKCFKIQGIWLAFPVAEIITFLISLFLLNKKSLTDESN